MPNHSEEVKSYLKVIFWSLLLFGLVFMPALALPFAHHDDYNFFVPVRRYGLMSYPHSITGMQLGRPLQVIINSLFMPFIDTVFDLRPLRAISIFFTALSTTLFSVWMVKRGLVKDHMTAFFISAAAFLAPGTQFYVIFINGIPMTVAVFLAVLSYLALDGIRREDFFSARVFREKRLYLSFGALFLSINTYQVPPMFFLAPTLAFFLFRETSFEEKRGVILRDLALFFAVLLTYFLAHRFVTLPLLAAKYEHVRRYMSEPSQYQFALSTDIPGKLNFFLRELTFQSLNLWNIYPKTYVALLNVSLIAGGVVLTLIKKPFKSAHAVQAFFLAAFILLLANAPNLMAKGGYPAYRTTFPYTAMLILVLFWAVWTVSCELIKKDRDRTMRLAALVFLVCGSLIAAFNTLNNAVNDTLELSFFRAGLMSEYRDDTTSLHVIKRTGDLSFLDLPGRYDEFNAPSTAYSQDIALMMHSLVKTGKEVAGTIKAETYPVVTDSTEGKTLYLPKESALIDMNSLLVPNGGKTREKRPETIYLSASGYSSGKSHSVGRAFDGSAGPDSFWEVGGDFPHWAEVELPAPEKLRGYEITAGEGVERMPKSWVLQGSNDRKGWVRIDERSHQTSWVNGENRRFEISSENAFKYYRFLITGGNGEILRVYEVKMDFQ